MNQILKIMKAIFNGFIYLVIMGLSVMAFVGIFGTLYMLFTGQV